jgi:hypothetical protein
MIGSANRRGATLGCGDCRIGRARAVGVYFSIEPDSRHLLGHVVQKCLFIFAGEELEEPQCRLQENVGIFILQVGSRQKIRTNHLQTVAARFVAAQHQSCPFDRLLDNRDLALV